MKAKDIYKMWNGSENQTNYDLYLFIDNKYIGKNIELTLKQPNKNSCEDKIELYVDFIESFTDFFGKFNQRDIRNDEDSFFLNLRARMPNGMCKNINLKNVDLFNELELNHFEVDNNRIIFIFELKGGHTKK